MSSPLGRLCYYRMLGQVRESLGSGASLRHRLGFGLAIATPFALFFVMLGLYGLMSNYFVQRFPNRPESIIDALQVGTLAVSIVTLLILFMEILREIGFARDQELLALAPLSVGPWILYRLSAILIRSLPYCAALLAFPVVFLLSSLPEARSPWVAAIFVPFFLFYWTWLSVLALVLAFCALALTKRLGMTRASTYAGLWLLSMGLTAATTYSFLDPDRWLSHAEWYAGSEAWFWLLPSHQIGLSLVRCLEGEPMSAYGHRLLAFASMAVTGLASWRIALILGVDARLPAFIPGGRACAGRLRGSRRAFGSTLPWAVLQKDLRDLLRNPVHRHALLASGILLPLALWGQARASRDALLLVSEVPSSRLMFSLLSLTYLIPFSFSMRAFSLDYRLLDLYRLTLRNPSGILLLKLYIHCTINLVLTAALALPFFWLLAPGFRRLELSWFLIVLILYVPVFTTLSIALGAVFPQLGEVPSAFGASKKGIFAYFTGSLFAFAFLLESYRRMAAGEDYSGILLGTAAATIALALGSLLLFVRARRKIDLGH